MDLLRLELFRCGKTQKEAAKIIGVSTSTFYRRMKQGVFGTDEAKRLSEALHIKEPEKIFF